MNHFLRTARTGLLAAAALAAVTAHADTAFTVNDTPVDQAVFDIYIASRLQKPADQATPDELATLQSELTDIYLLTTQPRAKELAEEPSVKAQLELQKRGILAQNAAQDFISRNPATEDEILAEYGRQIEKAPQVDFKASHILVETQASADELIKKLDDGADFATLAREYSTGPSGPNGGDLGWFAPNQMVPEFSAAVAKLEDGTYTKQPVQTQYGWHVILREDSRKAEPPTLDSVHDVIKQRIEQERLQEYLTQLRELDK